MTDSLRRAQLIALAEQIHNLSQVLAAEVAQDARRENYIWQLYLVRSFLDASSRLLRDASVPNFSPTGE